jgi:ABC-2 type transport system ATP-binding protein
VPDDQPVILTQGLGKRYDRTLALDDLNLEVRRGEVFGFLGPNGAGKTTTIRLLLGLIRPTAGAAVVLDLDPWADAVTLHRRVGYVPGEFAVWPQLTGREMLELLGNVHGGVDAAYREELMRRFELEPDKRGRSYSKGNRQKVGLIGALQSRADLLILDEPTSGLDPLMAAVFQACVREARDRGQTIFLSSHIMSEVEEVCDRVGILRRGRLADVGTLAGLRHLSARAFDLTFEGDAPRLDSVPGVEVLPSQDGAVRCRVHGDLKPFMQALAQSNVATLQSREPSLEEIFLRYYGPEDGAPEDSAPRAAT